MKRIGIVSLVAALGVAACGPDETPQQLNATVAFCDVCAPEGPNCELRTFGDDGTEMLCAKRPTTEVTVRTDQPSTTTTTTGGSTTTTTMPTNPNTLCGGSTNGTCPSGQTCQLSGATYGCVVSTPTGEQFANVAFARSGLVVTATFTGFATRNWRIQAGTDQEPSTVPMFLLPVGGSGNYGWNLSANGSPAISAASLAGRCQVSSGSAVCLITAASNEPFTWQGCDRDPSVNNQGCGSLAWFKTERLRPTGANVSVNSAWNFVVPQS